ncbi:YopX family protein [Bacillus tequilensis]|uniref:YopX protein domain-containing protein n=1 Tax=Bacillus tequilensis TaxID=227866 RepID=A0A6H0WHK9_9BACI|nr:YopX family protein [Bacillus tequilensis]QIW80030.1 hypothetical protein G4P54_09530 [Bacillus tequilensis]
MNTAYRVWDGKQMHYSFDDELTMIIEPSGAWEVKRNGIKGETVAHSHDGKSVLMWGTDQKGIYDGDVVLRGETMIGNPHGSEVLVGVVSMLEGQWCLVNTKTQETRPLFSETARNTVIGDGFYNPELLEAAE